MSSVVLIQTCRGCVVCCLPILAILPLMVVGRRHGIRQSDGTCMMGESRYATATVLGWDIISKLSRLSLLETRL